MRISLVKSIRSFQYAFKGIWYFFKEENNAKVHLLASVFVISLSSYFGLTSQEWLWIVLAIGLVWMAEAFNTAIEKLVDLVSPDFNARAGEVKDLAAGAVVFAATVALVIGIIIFKNYFIDFCTEHF
jgi:diacylglycerol kinase